MDDKRHTSPHGLPWPEAYLDLLPAIREQWGISEEIYLSRSLSGGKSGALVFAADINSREFNGQAILKLDRAVDPVWQEEHEADLIRSAIADAPEFAAKHLPKLIHSLHHGDQVAVLSTIAGRGLEYSEPWATCTFEQQMPVVRELSRGLLEDWNPDYRLGEGMYMPQDLLNSWLAYRLDPAAGGRLHRYLSEDFGLSPTEPSITFEGNWYPNPLAFAIDAQELPERLRIRAIAGHCHGDLHGYNVLAGRANSSGPNYYVIDLAMYQKEQFLLYDHAYFEIAHLLASRGTATQSGWNSILSQLSQFQLLEEKIGLSADDFGIVELVRALRQEAMDWIDRHEGDRLSYMESQYLLARVAAGLNFTNKSIPEDLRRLAFLYAASNLKSYLKLNRVDWPKHGPSFGLKNSEVDGSEADQTSSARQSPGSIETGVREHAAPDLSASAPGGESSVSPPTGRPTERTRFGSFFEDLRRRNVIKVAGVYVVVSWLIMQVATVLETALGLPSWMDSLVAVLLALGFPVACIVAWAFELSSGGLRPTTASERDVAGASAGGGFVDYVAAAGIVAILALTVGQYVYDHIPETALSTSGEQLTSLAVLPFKNLSMDGENDNFSDGLTIEIMNTLANTGRFRIPGRTSTFVYKDQPADLRKIGEALDVEYILEGSVRRFQDDLRIEAQLVQADDGFLVWSDVFIKNSQDLFLVQEAIANSLGTALKTPLGIEATELETERTDNPEAYNAFLKGLAFLERRGPDLRFAIDLLRESVNTEPNFAAGWAALSLVYGVAPIYLTELDGRPIVPNAVYRLAQEAALRANSLDPDLPIVQHALGNVYQRNRQWRAAEDKYGEALTVDPNDHMVMRDYSQLLAILGLWSRALAMADQMRALDPFNHLYEFIQALIVWQSDPNTQAVETLENIFLKYPEYQQIAIRPIIGYKFLNGQIPELIDIVNHCDTCDEDFKSRVLKMIDEAQTEPAEDVYNNYKDEFFTGYQFWETIGGAELALREFRDYSLRTEGQLQFFTVPWSIIGSVGQQDEFKQIAEDMGLLGYWLERGWPDNCRPLAGTDFECGVAAGSASVSN